MFFLDKFFVVHGKMVQLDTQQSAVASQIKFVLPVGRITPFATDLSNIFQKEALNKQNTQRCGRAPRVLRVHIHWRVEFLGWMW